MLERLRRERRGPRARASTALFEELEARRDVARERAARVLRSAALRGACSTGWWRPRATRACSRPRPSGRAATCCRALARALLAKGSRAPAGRSSDDSPDEDLHDVRKRAKRARYAAEAVAPALGREARPPGNARSRGAPPTSRTCWASCRMRSWPRRRSSGSRSSAGTTGAAEPRRRPDAGAPAAARAMPRAATSGRRGASWTAGSAARWMR